MKTIVSFLIALASLFAASPTLACEKVIDMRTGLYRLHGDCPPNLGVPSPVIATDRGYVPQVQHGGHVVVMGHNGYHEHHSHGATQFRQCTAEEFARRAAGQTFFGLLIGALRYDSSRGAGYVGSYQLERAVLSECRVALPNPGTVVPIPHMHPAVLKGVVSERTTVHVPERIICDVHGDGRDAFPVASTQECPERARQASAPTPTRKTVPDGESCHFKSGQTSLGWFKNPYFDPVRGDNCDKLFQELRDGRRTLDSLERVQ